MATKDYGQTYYATDADAVDVAAISEATAESLEGRTVRSFASTGARDDALATLTTEQKKGATAHVMGLGLFYYSGSVWRRVPANGENFIQSAVSLVDCEATGLAYIPFPVAFGGKPVVTATRYTSVYGPEGLTMAINDNGSGSVTSAGFHVYVTKLSGAPYDSFVHVSWLAQGPRAAD